MAKYNPFDNYVAVMDKAAGVMGISRKIISLSNIPNVN